MPNELTPAMEDYIETIAYLNERKEVVRVSDIGKALGVKNPSVNSALKKLARKGLVRHERYGYVGITASGVEAARKVQKKHNDIALFLTKVLGIDSAKASEDACRMEHVISPETLRRLTEFLRFTEKRFAEGEMRWIKEFKRYIKKGKDLEASD